MFSLDDLPRRLANLDVLFMNRACSEKIGPDLSRASRRAHDLGPQLVVTTLGADGCFVLDREGNETYVRGHAVEAVDTTGAGDCFAGSFAYGLLADWQDIECAELANLAAAISTTAVGSREAVMDKNRLRACAREKGYSWWQRIV
jgi:sugar/nucleoside kinase (ribokinase family)